MASLHVHPDVEILRVFESVYVGPDPLPVTLAAEMEHRARALLRADGNGHAAVEVLRRNHGEAGGGQGPLTEAEALVLVCRDHGFAQGRLDAEEGARIHDSAFEAAVDAAVGGGLEELRRRLRAEPGLATARSSYGHGATLLHYLVANGVEIRRQVVSTNAPKLAVALIEAGADVHATMMAYGEAHTPLDLLQDSVHPGDAGVARDLRHVLRVSDPSS